MKHKGISDYTKEELDHIRDCANMKVLDFGMEGITEQETTSGKNIWNPQSTDYVDGTYRGWKVKNDTTKNMTITIIDKNNGADISGIYFGLTTNGKNSSGAPRWLIDNGTILKTKITLATHEYVTAYSTYLPTVAKKILYRFDVMVELGDTFTSYEPFTNGASPNPDYPQDIKLAGVLNEETGRYEIKCTISDENEENSQPFTLTSPAPLTKWDKLVKRDGVYGWSINNIRYKFTGDEDIAVEYSDVSGKNGYYVRTKKDFAQTYEERQGSVCFCNKFTGVYGKEISEKSFTRDYVCSFVRASYLTFMSLTADGVFETIGSFREYLKTAGVEVYGKSTKEQAFIPLPDEEQTLLHNLETYYGVTNVYNEQGCPISLSYISDPELHWNQKLEQINNALLSLGANV